MKQIFILILFCLYSIATTCALLPNLSDLAAERIATQLPLRFDYEIENHIPREKSILAQFTIPELADKLKERLIWENFLVFVKTFSSLISIEKFFDEDMQVPEQMLLTPDNNYLIIVSGSSNNALIAKRVTVINLNSIDDGLSEGIFNFEVKNSINNIAISKNSRYFALSTILYGKEVLIYDLVDQKFIKIINSSSIVTSLLFLHNDEHLLIGTWTNLIRVNLEDLSQEEISKHNIIANMHNCLNYKVLYSESGQNNNCYILDLSNHRKKQIKSLTGLVSSMDVNANRRLALAASYDNAIHLVDLKNLKYLCRFDFYDSWISSVKFIPWSNLAFASSKDGKVILFDIKSGIHKLLWQSVRHRNVDYINITNDKKTLFWISDMVYKCDLYAFVCELFKLSIEELLLIIKVDDLSNHSDVVSLSIAVWAKLYLNLNTNFKYLLDKQYKIIIEL